MRFSNSVFATVLTLVAALGTEACSKAVAPPPAPPPPKVLVAPVKQVQVNLFDDNVGQLDGYVNAEIRARVRGYLKQQAYRDGSQVKAGQLLFTIDPVEYQAALDSARGTLARAHMPLMDAALEGAKLRLRPIIMTSLAFIFGCLPLVVASGAGAGGRQVMGITVVSGMLAATAVGIFFIPALFVFFEKIAGHKDVHVNAPAEASLPEEAGRLSQNMAE